MTGPSGVQPTVPSEEAELVAAARGGSRPAFEELVRQTYADTYSLARRITGNEEDARDVVQEVYLRAFKGLKKFRGDAQLSTWLYRITANCAATHMRKRGRNQHVDLDDLRQVADDRPEIDPSARADASMLRQRVDEALAELPEGLREVVVLRDVYDMPHEEIAEALGISEGAAKVRLHRARQRLRERLFPRRGEEDAHAV